MSKGEELHIRIPLTCFPHFQSGPRITRVPTPSSMKRFARFDVDGGNSIYLKKKTNKSNTNQYFLSRIIKKQHKNPTIQQLSQIRNDSPKQFGGRAKQQPLLQSTPLPGNTKFHKDSRFPAFTNSRLSRITMSEYRQHIENSREIPLSSSHPAISECFTKEKRLNKSTGVST